MTILWDTDPRAAEHYAFALGADVTVVESGSGTTRALGTDPGQTLVVIGPDVDLAAACGVADSIRVDRPEVGVVLLRRRPDVAVLGQALRSGVREVVPPDDLSALADACRRSRELSARMGLGVAAGRGQSGQVVTVFSAKGGVGKTTISTNLAAYLARAGHHTLLVDLDLAFGDVAISLHIDQSDDVVKSFEDVVAMTGHLDEQGLRSVIHGHDSGLDILCAPTNPAAVERIPAEAVTEVLRLARHLYDFVIVDTPPAITDYVLASFDLSDSIVLIATLDIPALKNLRVTLETLDKLGSPREARIVTLNRSDAKVGLTTDDVVTALKHDISVMIPGSVDVPAAVNHGLVMTLDQPKHPVSLAIKDLADRYLLGGRTPETPTVDPAPPETERPRRLIGWGGRR